MKIIVFIWIFVIFISFKEMGINLSLIFALLLYFALLFTTLLKKFKLNIIALVISLSFVAIINDIAIPLVILLLLISLIAIYLVKLKWPFFVQIALSLILYFTFFS
jgi:hypothetical protein